VIGGQEVMDELYSEGELGQKGVGGLMWIDRSLLLERHILRKLIQFLDS
jgi:hypothetical protein